MTNIYTTLRAPCKSTIAEHTLKEGLESVVVWHNRTEKKFGKSETNKLLQYFQQQSICNNYHRYGNLGERSMDL